MDDRLDVRLREIPSGETHALIARIAEIDEFKGWWRGRGLPDPALLKVRRRVVAASAAASARIAGATRPQRYGRPGGMGRPEEQAASQVAGYAEVLQAVFDGYREMQFGQDLILQFHARVLRYSRRDHFHRGRYKVVSDTAVSSVRRTTESSALRAADPDLTPGLMAAATRWTAARLTSPTFHPLLVIAGFVLEFLAIRPFADGNGRLSRLLTGLLLLQSGYSYLPYASLESVIAERWTEYYLALRRSQVNAALPRPDITPWLHGFLGAMQAHVRQLRTAIGTRPDDSRLSRNQLRALSLLERHEELTNRLVCRELGTPKDTAKQVLNRLLALNMLRRVGAGRAVRYRKAPPQDGGEAAR